MTTRILLLSALAVGAVSTVLLIGILRICHDFPEQLEEAFH